MDAQEAIERIEKQLNESKKQTASYGADMNRDPFTLALLEDEDEALSIVLESAKYLHQDILEPSRQTEWRGKADKRLSILYDIPEEGIEIMADDLERIGIVEGADE